MGKKAFVTIAGTTYQEGDEIKGFTIDNISNIKITFKKGNITFAGDIGF